VNSNATLDVMKNLTKTSQRTRNGPTVQQEQELCKSAIPMCCNAFAKQKKCNEFKTSDRKNSTMTKKMGSESKSDV